MPRRKHKEFSLTEALKKMKDAGLNKPLPKNKSTGEIEGLPTRVQNVYNLFKQSKNTSNKMIYFVMYDIENDKVRNYIAKYLINKGCTRVQKSVFIAETERKIHEEIHETLKEVQSYYNNEDSIFIIPVSTDELQAMKIIGQSIDFNMFFDKPNTLFF